MFFDQLFSAVTDDVVAAALSAAAAAIPTPLSSTPLPAPSTPPLLVPIVDGRLVAPVRPAAAPPPAPALKDDATGHTYMRQVMELAPLPDTIAGPYGAHLNIMPVRARFMQPRAARDFMAADAECRARGGALVVSDVLRTLESSLARVRDFASRNPPQFLAAMPGFSDHNGGDAVDALLEPTKEQRQHGIVPPGGGMVKLFGDLNAFRDFMVAHNFHGYRLDGHDGDEAWHFGHFDTPELFAECFHAGDTSTAPAAARRVAARWGALWEAVSLEDAQLILRFLKDEKGLPFYDGKLDGPGPLTTRAISRFQERWGLNGWHKSAGEYGTLGPCTKRVLVYASSAVKVVPVA